MKNFFESYKELYGASDPLSSEGYRINFGAVNINLYIIAYWIVHFYSPVVSSHSSTIVFLDVFNYESLSRRAVMRNLMFPFVTSSLIYRVSNHLYLLAYQPARQIRIVVNITRKTNVSNNECLPAGSGLFVSYLARYTVSCFTDIFCAIVSRRKNATVHPLANDDAYQRFVSRLFRSRTFLNVSFLSQSSLPETQVV